VQHPNAVCKTWPLKLSLKQQNFAILIWNTVNIAWAAKNLLQLPRGLWHSSFRALFRNNVDVNVNNLSRCLRSFVCLWKIKRCFTPVQWRQNECWNEDFFSCNEERATLLSRLLLKIAAKQNWRNWNRTQSNILKLHILSWKCERVAKHQQFIAFENKSIKIHCKVLQSGQLHY